MEKGNTLSFFLEARAGGVNKKKPDALNGGDLQS